MKIRDSKKNNDVKSVRDSKKNNDVKSVATHKYKSFMYSCKHYGKILTRGKGKQQNQCYMASNCPVTVGIYLRKEGY